MSASLYFEQVTPSAYAALVADAAKAGIAIKGNPCEVKAHGCDVEVRYDETLCNLFITILSAPPFCMGIAAHKLHDLVESALSGNPQPQ